MISTTREVDGRWIAEYEGVRGALAYGVTQEEAAAKAQRLAYEIALSALEAARDEGRLHPVQASILTGLIKKRDERKECLACVHVAVMWYQRLGEPWAATAAAPFTVEPASPKMTELAEQVLREMDATSGLPVDVDRWAKDLAADMVRAGEREYD